MVAVNRSRDNEECFGTTVVWPKMRETNTRRYGALPFRRPEALI